MRQHRHQRSNQAQCQPIPELQLAVAWKTTRLTWLQVGMETFRMCRSLLDGVILVDNSAISAAIKDVFNETRSILEPAGAVAVAGAKAYLSRHGLEVALHSCIQHSLRATI